MVNGLAKFQEHFAGYEDTYIIIGGTACDRYLEETGRVFRATNDLDIIIIAEVLNPEFVKHFWDFVEAGRYASLEKEETAKQFFRFKEPAEVDYPFQLELFSRLPDVIEDKEGMRYTPIPED